MPTPMGSLTLEDLILRVAEADGCADYATNTDGRAGIPTDPHDLDKCLRAVNDGRREFYKRCPKLPSLRPEVTMTLTEAGDGPLNLDGAPGRLRLPWWVAGGPVSVWSWAAVETTWSGQAPSTSLERVNRMLNTTLRKGAPEMVGIGPLTGRELGPAVPKPGWQIRVYPLPSQTFTLTAQFNLLPLDMSEMSQEEPTGSAHAQTIVAFAMSILRQNKPDATDRAYWADLATERAARSLAYEQSMQEKTLGPLTNPSVTRDRVRTPRQAFVVSEINGVAIN